MPLDKPSIDRVMDYCKKHLPSDPNWFLNEFDFIKTKTLQRELAKEFYTTRYVYKLMEALASQGNELHAHLKFQIIQYASIYEACINYLLQEVFKNHEEVLKIKTHKALKEVPALSKLAQMSYSGEVARLCVIKDTRTPWNSVPFENKVEASVAIGFLKRKYADEIKGLYNMRNTVHIEAAAKRQIQFQIQEAQLAYKRMRPFVDDIKNFLAGMPEN